MIKFKTESDPNGDSRHRGRQQEELCRSVEPLPNRRPILPPLNKA